VSKTNGTDASTGDPFEEFARAKADAVEGSSDAMIWLGNHYESGVRGGPRANGHKALCYYMAAFRREPRAWAHVMGRVVSDMDGYFNPLAPGGGVRFSPLSDEMKEEVRRRSLRSISLFPELARFLVVPVVLRCLAVESALSISPELGTEPLEFGDWRAALVLAEQPDIPSQLEVA
jgi:hypothetical protein